MSYAPCVRAFADARKEYVDQPAEDRSGPPIANAMQHKFIADIERLSGRNVLAFISNHHVGPDVEIELFLLKPELAMTPYIARHAWTVGSLSARFSRRHRRLSGVHPGPLMSKIIMAMALLGLAIVPASASADDFPGYPENSNTFPYFATPSGRIACDYRAKQVSCTNYEGSAERGQDVWYVKSRGRGWYEPIMANFPSQDLPRAKYRVTYRYRGIKCRIHKTRGIKCTNRGGHGFRVSIERQTTF